LFELKRLITAYEGARPTLAGVRIGSAILAFLDYLKLEPTTFAHVHITLLHLMTVRHFLILLGIV
jgi:hypothetical protein